MAVHCGATRAHTQIAQTNASRGRAREECLAPRRTPVLGVKLFAQVFREPAALLPLDAEPRILDHLGDRLDDVLLARHVRFQHRVSVLNGAATKPQARPPRSGFVGARATRKPRQRA
eukprot:7333574-Prymnesium_polylepis.1